MYIHETLIVGFILLYWTWSFNPATRWVGCLSKWPCGVPCRHITCHMSQIRSNFTPNSLHQTSPSTNDTAVSTSELRTTRYCFYSRVMRMMSGLFLARSHQQEVMSALLSRKTCRALTQMQLRIPSRWRRLTPAVSTALTTCSIDIPT